MVFNRNLLVFRIRISLSPHHCFFFFGHTRDLRASVGVSQRQARLCQLVFKHASEALSFAEAFDAICDNPVGQQRKVGSAVTRTHAINFLKC